MIPSHRRDFDVAQSPLAAANALRLQPGVHVQKWSALLDALAGNTSGAWTAYTPTVAAGSGTLTTATATGRWFQLGEIVHFNARITITTNGTGGTYITATLPTDARATTQAINGYHETFGEVMTAVILSSATSAARLTNSAGEYPGADGAIFVISGTYEAA